jgi:antitoxin VapB
MAKAREPVAAYRADPSPRAGTRAKLFANGRSQAVRLPKAFRMPGDEVRISRDGDRIILEPLTSGPFDEAAWLAEVAAIAAHSRPPRPGATLDDILADMRDDER